MKSMTGYGKARYADAEYEIEIEIKSVNNRFLDVNFRLPRELTFLESELNDIINQKIKRGKVYINLNYSNLKGSELDLNEENLQTYWNIYNKAAAILGTNNDVSLSKVLSEPEVVVHKACDLENSDFKNKLLSLFDQALQEHEKMALKEGISMQNYFVKSVDTMENSLKEIAAVFPGFKEERFKKLKSNIEKLLCEKLNDENLKRIMLEAAIYIEKADITEEVVRFKDHLKKIKQKINKNNSQTGKSINFILQEMHREINTIGSKFTGTAVFDEIIIIKEEIEKCREIVQNVE